MGSCVLDGAPMRPQKILFPFAGEDPPRHAVGKARAILGQDRPDVCFFRLIGPGGDAPTPALDWVRDGVVAGTAMDLLAFARRHPPSVVAVTDALDLPSPEGSPTELLVREARVPLLLLREGEHPGEHGPRRIVVPVLRDPGSDDALAPLARGLAEAADATVILLGLSGTAPAVSSRVKVEATLDDWHGRLRGIPALKRVVGGAPGDEIVDAAEEDDLIAMLADGPWDFVVKNARCSVLVVNAVPRSRVVAPD